MRKFAGILVLFIGVATYGQQNFASISFGMNMPLGDYGSTGDLSSSGYANNGGAIKFDAGYFPGSYLGIGGSFSFASNYAMRDSLLNDMLTYLDEYGTSEIQGPIEDAQYGAGFWNNINLFLGPHFSIRASQKLYFDLRVLAGISILRPPDQELYVLLENGNEIFSTTSGHKVAFGFTAGGGLRYKLNEALALKVAVDFIQSKANFEYEFALFQGVATAPPVQANFAVRSLEMLVGLAYSF
jgi:opacity protein-like surface antigen